MERRNIIILLTLLMSMMSISATAYDIEVSNSDGVIIYYTWANNGTELSVSYRGSSNTLISNGYSGSVVIPETVTYNGIAYPVTSIGNRAFSSCSSLTNVTIPNSVTSIGSRAFSDCMGLTSVTIPNSVTSIGGNAFDGTTWYNNQPDGLVYAGKVAYKYKGTMPSNTSIILKEGTLGIATDAFRYCSGLTSVTIPNSVTSICSQAFYGCSGLTSLTIPNSVTSIGREAFFHCIGLTSVTIGNSVTSIGSQAFSYCSDLTSIKVESGNTVYDSRDNCNAIIATETNELIAGCKNTTIPNSVTSIGDDAFHYCSGLTSATIPNSVTSIGSQAFSGCSGLTSIKVESGNTVYDSRDNCNAIITTETNELVAGCKNTTIPNSVTSIGDNAFYECSGLTSVAIPNSVTSIGQHAFSRCNGLTSVTIGNSVTSICDYAFSGCNFLTSVTIGNSVKSIGREAFHDCIGLTSLTIPNSVTSIGEQAFFYCYGLTSVTIGNSVTSIGDHAFACCRRLTSLTIGNSVTSIGGWAFYECSGLTSLTIPNSVTSIGASAFEYCSGLTSVTIPNSVTSISVQAFSHCSSLTSVTIGNSVTSIGGWAFSNCSRLINVTVKSETPISINSSIFSNRTNATLYVPYGCKAAYAAAAYWRDFKEIVEFVDETDISEMDNVIYIEPTEVISGNQAVLSVKMKNNVAIQTIQFDLYLPEGVTIVANEDGELITASKARINKFNYFNSTVQSNGALRLLAQATTTNVPAGDGEICRVTVNVPESMDEGDYPIIFKDILMVEANNTSHSPEPNVVQCKLTVLPYTPGDANNDGEINAIDFNMIGNYILGNHSQANFSFRAADFNNDGDVNAIDFNMVGNYILYGSSAPSSRATRKEETLDPQ